MILLKGTSNSGEKWALSKEDLNGESFFAIEVSDRTGNNINKGGFGIFGTVGLREPLCYFGRDPLKSSRLFVLLMNSVTSSEVEFQDASVKKLDLNSIESLPSIKIGVILFPQNQIPITLIVHEEHGESRYPITTP